MVGVYLTLQSLILMESPAMPHLIMKAADHAYKIFRIASDVSIGRHPGNDIVLNASNNNTISRCHAKILHDQEGFLLQDNSLNGTRLNDQFIESHRLQNGDLFHIANCSFTFIEDASVEPIDSRGDATNVANADGDGLRETEEIVRCEGIVDDLSDQELIRRLKASGVIIKDKQMMALYRDIHAIARLNVPVLILGEPGTGKEKVAQAIHEFSQAAGEFVPVNCSAIPENLFESELFGSVKGAYSDAATKPGKLEMAENGTLFLDEIGDMSLACQPKLLRFLESRSFSRLGETQVRELNIRIVAATNQDLNHMIDTQTFRPDLFQRLACIKLKIPPLRKRKQDILPLAEFFLAAHARQYGFTPLKISHQAAQMMRAYYWPGNVRELANIMLNACVRTRGGTITADHLIAASEEIGAVGSSSPEFLSLNDMEKKHIRKALEETGNNKSKAAALLSISRDTLYKKIKKYGIL
jgi:transcriptional regulator with PAS, ATPase and Fis domain